VGGGDVRHAGRSSADVGRVLKNLSGRLTRDRQSVGQEAGDELQRRHRLSQQEEPYRRSYSFHVGRSIKGAVRWALGFPRGSSRPGQLALAREQGASNQRRSTGCMNGTVVRSAEFAKRHRRAWAFSTARVRPTLGETRNSNW